MYCNVTYIVIASTLLQSPVITYFSTSHEVGDKIESKANAIIIFELKEKGPLQRVTFSPDGNLVAVGNGSGGISIWDIRSKKERRSFQFASRAPGGIFAPSGNYLVTTIANPGSFTNTVKAWNLESGKELFSDQGEYTIARVLSDDRFVVVTRSSVQFRNLKTGLLLKEFPQKIARFTSMHVSADGKFFANRNTDNSIAIRNVENGDLVTTLKGHDSIARHNQFFPDGKSILTAGMNEIRLWNSKTGAMIYEIKTSLPTMRLAISGDGKILAVGTGSVTPKIHLHHASNGEYICTVDNSKLPITSIDLNHNGTKLAVCRYNYVKVFELKIDIPKAR